jgi:hypothetical protein
MKWILFIMSLLAAIAVFLLIALHHVPVQVPHTVVVESHFFAPNVTKTETVTEMQLKFDSPQMVLIAAVVAGFTLIGWPIVGATVVWVTGNLRDWAYGRHDRQLDEAERIGLASIWPLTFIYSVVVYPSMGIIHRLFWSDT